MTRILHHLRQAYREWRMGRAALTLIRLADADNPHDRQLMQDVHRWLELSAFALAAEWAVKRRARR